MSQLTFSDSIGIWPCTRSKNASEIGDARRRRDGSRAASASGSTPPRCWRTATMISLIAQLPHRLLERTAARDHARAARPPSSRPCRARRTRPGSCRADWPAESDASTSRASGPVRAEHENAMRHQIRHQRQHHRMAYQQQPADRDQYRRPEVVLQSRPVGSVSAIT